MEHSLALALSGGDDYELCLTARAGSIEVLQDEFERTHAVSLTRVGVVEEGAGVRIRRADGSIVSLQRQGYRHFETPG
jgi:thiamine-monophosphate kinase